MTRKWLIFVSLVFIACLATLNYHGVPNNITAEDAVYISKIYDASSTAPIAQKATSFAQQIGQIRAVQKAVLNASPVQKKIPKGHPREPKDLYTLGYAECGDRARTMAKMLEQVGYEVRHVAVYSTDKTGSAFESLITSDRDLVRSHAIIEVLTKKGWLVVDTVDAWISLDKQGNPISMANLQKRIEVSNMPQWDGANQGQIYFLFKKPFTFVYGLYSRHGYFYPPYTPIPDINWSAFSANIYRLLPIEPAAFSASSP